MKVGSMGINADLLGGQHVEIHGMWVSVFKPFDHNRAADENDVLFVGTLDALKDSMPDVFQEILKMNLVKSAV